MGRYLVGRAASVGGGAGETGLGADVAAPAYSGAVLLLFVLIAMSLFVVPIALVSCASKEEEEGEEEEEEKTWQQQHQQWRRRRGGGRRR